MLPIISPNPFYPVGWGVPGQTNDVNALIRAINVEMLAEKTGVGVVNPSVDLFKITGGPIMILEFSGVVTTLIGATVSTCQIQLTTIAPAGTVNLSTAVAIETDAVGTSYTFTAAAPGVLTPTTAGGLANVPVLRWLAEIGTIKAAFSASTTGAISWGMVYKKLSPDSLVTVL